jgi:hypothetical protein
MPKSTSVVPLPNNTVHNSARRQSYSQIRRLLYLSQIFHTYSTFSLLVEIEGHFSHNFVTWEYKTQE